jgi:hypothetical protein
MCRRARIVWDRLNGKQELFALPTGEYLRMVAPSPRQKSLLGIGRRSVWTPEREETLVRLFNEGKPWRVILGEVGVCYEAARRVVKRKGLTRTRTRRAPAPGKDRRTAWTPERIAELERLCSLGVSWRAIAEELGTCTETVMKMALRKQITKPRSKRPRSKAVPPPSPAAGDRIRKAQSAWTGDRLKELRRLSNDGFSWKEIGKRLGVRGPTARIAAVRHNILCKRTPQGWSK